MSKMALNVSLCRVDELSIEVFDNFTGKDNTTVRKLPTYDFRARFNVSTGKNDETMQKAINEYNLYLCNTNDNSVPPYAWAYGGYKKEQLDEIDGCDGILEFHFVDANINAKSGVTMPEVRYCPTYDENKDSATRNYYYISTTSRFYINSDGKTAQYQTGGAGKWTTQYSMTYNNDKWTIN